MKANEVVVEKHGWQKGVDKEVHGLQTRSKWILYQTLLLSVTGEFILKYLVFVREPDKGTQNLIWTLNVICFSLHLIKGQSLFCSQSRLIEVEHLLFLQD